jgi:cathepsin X
LKKDYCEDIDICRECSPPVCDVGSDAKCIKEHCWAVKFKKHYVSDYYPVSGAAKMKADIYKHGPLGCGIQATDNFEKNYTGGIYKEYIKEPELNHEISIVGWGVSDEGEEYWVGRNSWGTYWGEYGFFKLPMNDLHHNLGVETDCAAAIPSYKAMSDSATPAVEFIQ